MFIIAYPLGQVHSLCYTLFPDVTSPVQIVALCNSQIKSGVVSHFSLTLSIENGHL